MEKDKTIYSTGEAARYLGVATKTLQRWDTKGKLVASRSSADRRCYTREELDKVKPKPANAVTLAEHAMAMDVSHSGEEYVVTLQKNGFSGTLNVNGTDLSLFVDKASKLL